MLAMFADRAKGGSDALTSVTKSWITERWFKLGI
jgi:hypothetical protein